MKTAQHISSGEPVQTGDDSVSLAPTQSSRHDDTKGRGNSPGIGGETEEERGSLGWE